MGSRTTLLLGLRFISIVQNRGLLKTEERNDSPGKVQHTQSVNVCLVRWRRMHPMNTRLDKPTRQSRQSITSINSDSPILRLDPFPLVLRVEDLQGGNRLTEQEGQRAKVCVSGDVQGAKLLVLLLASGGVVHVAEVVFALDVVLVGADELVFVGKFEEDCEEAEEFDYDFVVAFLKMLELIMGMSVVWLTRLKASISLMLVPRTGG